MNTSMSALTRHAARQALPCLVALLSLVAGPFAANARAATPWQDISPPLGVAPLRIGLVESDPDLLFLGSWGEGLYRSSDRGATWTQVYNDFYLGEGLATDAVVEVAFDGSGSRGVAITFSGTYTSIDGGRSWRRHDANTVGDSPGIGFAIVRIPDGSGVVASEAWSAGRSGAAWIYEWETDSWRVFHPSMFLWPGAGTLGLDFDTSSPPNLYICNTTRNMYSDDMGASLRSNAAGLPYSGSSVIVCDPKIPQRVLTAIGNQLYLQVARGTAWTPHGAPLPSPVNALIHDPDNAGRMFAGTDNGVWESHDRGATWTQLDRKGLAYFKVIDLKIHPMKTDEMLVAVAAESGAAGGLYRIVIDSVGAAPGDDGPLSPARRLVATPNPTGSQTEISVQGSLPSSGRPVVEVYDLRGRRVRTIGADGGAAVGEGPFHWDARDDAGAAVPSGVYVLRMRSGDSTLATGRVTIRQ